MKLGFAAVAAFAAALLGSCGGGGGDTPDPGPDTSLPVLNVTLSDDEKTVRIPEGGEATFGFTATYEGTSTQPIVADVTIDARRYRLVGTPTQSGNTYTVNFETVPFPAGGLTTSQIVFRLCTTAACTSVYPGSAKALILYLDVQFEDWQTLQRTAAHRGHVNVVYDSADFKKKWEFAAATGAQVGAVAATTDGVFLTENTSDGKFFAIGLDSTAGERRWRTDLGTDPASDPAYFDGNAYYTQTAADGTRRPQVFDALDGTRSVLPTYGTTAGRMNQPVPFANSLYLIAGQTGREAYSYNLANGTRTWRQNYGGVVWDKAAMAVDANYAYAFNGPSLVLLARGSGAVAATFANPDFTGGTVWNSAPILDGAGRVFASTRSREFTDASPIAAWSIASGARLWMSTELYSTAPALGQRFLFAVNPAQRRIDAINPANGTVVYSIAIPGTGALTGNLVATRRHLFVSTASDSYAFNIVNDAHPQAWTAAVGGKLAITPDNLLIISGGAKVTAYRLW